MEFIRRKLETPVLRALILLDYFRGEQGLEMDFVVPGKNGAITLIECKASQTVMPAMAGLLLRLSDIELIKNREDKCNTRAPGVTEIDVIDTGRHQGYRRCCRVSL